MSISWRDAIERDGIPVSKIPRLKRLELCFVNLESLAPLTACTRLQELTLISNQLRCIMPLEACSRTLWRLRVTHQKISSVSPVSELSNLKDLFLHNNQITSIKGVESCVRLERLWLFSNQLSSIEELASLTCLKELLLQSNRLQSLHSVRDLRELEVLNVADNPIKDIRCVTELKGLQRLRDLSFADVDFGRCPVVKRDEYRPLLLNHLPNVVILDGAPLRRGERQAALAARVSSERAVARRLLAVQDTCDAEIKAILKRRNRVLAACAQRKQMLLDGLQDLSALMETERAEAVRYYHQQEAAHEAARQELEDKLTIVTTEAHQSVDKWISRFKKDLALTERRIIERRRQVELAREEAVCVRALCTAYAHVILSPVPLGSPSSRAVLALVGASDLRIGEEHVLCLFQMDHDWISTTPPEELHFVASAVPPSGLHDLLLNSAAGGEGCHGNVRADAAGAMQTVPLGDDPHRHCYLLVYRGQDTQIQNLCFVLRTSSSPTVHPRDIEAVLRDLSQKPRDRWPNLTNIFVQIDTAFHAYEAARRRSADNRIPESAAHRKQKIQRLQDEVDEIRRLLHLEHNKQRLLSLT